MDDELLLYTTRRFDPVRDENSGDDSNKSGEEQYEVKVIDNDYNTYEEVIKVVMLALGVSFEEAYSVAWEIDHLGSCVVAHGSWEACSEIASIIGGIGIETQVNPIGEQPR
jgi:ATP-dependent Clp protease adapter protein ClpS